jgi:hypothetical protein
VTEAKLRGDFIDQANVLNTAVGRPWMTAKEARVVQNFPDRGVAEDAELVVPVGPNYALEGMAAAVPAPAELAVVASMPSEGLRRQLVEFFDRQEGGRPKMGRDNTRTLEPTTRRWSVPYGREHQLRAVNGAGDDPRCSRTYAGWRSSSPTGRHRLKLVDHAFVRRSRRSKHEIDSTRSRSRAERTSGSDHRARCRRRMAPRLREGQAIADLLPACGVLSESRSNPRSVVGYARRRRIMSGGITRHHGRAICMTTMRRRRSPLASDGVMTGASAVFAVPGRRELLEDSRR